MRRTAVLPATAILAALILTGCTANQGSSEMSDSYAPPPAEDQSRIDPNATDSFATVPDNGGVELATPETLPQAVSGGRDVITTGYVTVVVDDPSDSATDAVRIAESVGGRVDARSETTPPDGGNGSSTLTLRLPAERLDEALEQLKELGEATDVSTSANDVTMQTSDLDARVTALTASVDRLLALLPTAGDTETLIQLESALSERQAELESLQSQRRYLGDQVALSTVTLTLISPADAPADNPDNFFSGLSTGWDAFLGFFAGVVVVLGVLVPWLVLAAIITAVLIVVLRRRKQRQSR